MSSCATCTKCGPNLFTCNENIAHVMPCGITCAMMSCANRAAYACRQAGPLCIHGMPGITYGHAVRTSQTIFIKINHLTF